MVGPQDFDLRESDPVPNLAATDHFFMNGINDGLHAQRHRGDDGHRGHRRYRRSSFTAAERQTYVKWSSRLELLSDMRTELIRESGPEDVLNSLDTCIESVSKHMDSAFFRDSRHDARRAASRVNRETRQSPDSDRLRHYEPSEEFRAPDLEARQRIVAHASQILEEEEKLPGLSSYSMAKMMNVVDELELLEEELEAIPDTMVMEANILEYHFHKQLIHNLFSRKWMNRIKAVDEAANLLESNAIMELNCNSVQQAVTGVGKILTRLFQDHALKVMVKSLELLDAYFDFMDRNGCCALSSSRQHTARHNAVNCGLEFIEALIGRMGDRVSAVVNCAVCALLKVAESNTIPTYEDVANCLLRSLATKHQNTSVRSICNRLRLLSTVLLRSHGYNSHNLTRLSIKPVHFHDSISPLCQHVNGNVRTMAAGALAIGVKTVFKDHPFKMQDAVTDMVEKTPKNESPTYWQRRKQFGR
ncbi:hypothetical protein BgAZ_305420 [Babesia gibsoni]|uniref:TOG domain-containing protein n=1 Tax=Babesia gibsoni TaxID=33632 RepID=A0AAD8LIV5_BABGI|nr:hypothetical protein BgAZ_305420 [Babesia gibsoni]